MSKNYQLRNNFAAPNGFIFKAITLRLLLYTPQKKILGSGPQWPQWWGQQRVEWEFVPDVIKFPPVVLMRMGQTWGHCDLDLWPVATKLVHPWVQVDILCHTGRNPLKVVLMYPIHKNVINMSSQWPSPLTTKVSSISSFMSKSGHLCQFWWNGVPNIKKCYKWKTRKHSASGQDYHAWHEHIYVAMQAFVEVRQNILWN